MLWYRSIAVCLLLASSSLASQDDDALVEPSVIGGVVSQAGEYPWVGALVYLDESDLTKAQFCGCSLIDEQWILTAAHCLDGTRVGEVGVAFGNGDLSEANLVVPIDLIVMHPEYFDVIDLENDMALARLVRPVEGIEPIRLNRDADTVDIGAPVRVMGWGLTDLVQNEPSPVSELREADLSVLDRDWINSEDRLDGGVSETMLPIGTLNPLVTSSFGDSGGPMVVSVTGEYLLAGVTSWGTGCFTGVLPYSVYTNVISHLDWIDGVVNRDRLYWEDYYDSQIADNEEAYRLGRSPLNLDDPMMFADEEGLQTDFFVRPFSRSWMYRLNYYDVEAMIWRALGWDFQNGIFEDGSMEVFLPDDLKQDSIIIRSEQVERSAAGPELIDLALHQLVSGSFGDLSEQPFENARVFRISRLERALGHTVFVSTEGGSVRYVLRTELGEKSSGEIDGRGEIAFAVEEGYETWLYLLPLEGGVEFSVYLTRDDIAHIGGRGSGVGALELGDAILGDSGHLVDSFALGGNPGELDVIAIVESNSDMAIRIMDTDTLMAAGQSNGWPQGSPEYLIFNRSSRDNPGLDGLSLLFINAEPEVFGAYDFELLQFEEWRELSLSDGNDFRALSVRDYTDDPFDGYEYVDRVELTGLGSGRRFVRFLGLESFRPRFALRNITDNVIVQQFDRAFCYESSVIEFTAVLGKRYEVIIAASECSLNKNYFLELSVTRPPDPYENFATLFSEENSKMQKWLQRLKSREGNAVGVK